MYLIQTYKPHLTGVKVSFMQCLLNAVNITWNKKKPAIRYFKTKDIYIPHEHNHVRTLSKKFHVSIEDTDKTWWTSKYKKYILLKSQWLKKATVIINIAITKDEKYTFLLINARYPRYSTNTKSWYSIYHWYKCIAL